MSFYNFFKNCLTVAQTVETVKQKDIKCILFQIHEALRTDDLTKEEATGLRREFEKFVKEFKR